jgi:hypothetical protein
MSVRRHVATAPPIAAAPPACLLCGESPRTTCDLPGLGAPRACPSPDQPAEDEWREQVTKRIEEIANSERMQESQLVA